MVMMMQTSIIEYWNVFRGPRARQRFHKCINIGDVLVGQHRIGISRHVIRRITNLALETVKGERRAGKDRGRPVIGAALAGAAVTREAAERQIDPLAVAGIAARFVLSLGLCLGLCWSLGLGDSADAGTERDCGKHRNASTAHKSHEKNSS